LIQRILTTGQREELDHQPVTRSTTDSVISFTFSTPSVTAAVVCCASSFATLVTREIGLAVFAPLELRPLLLDERLLDFFAALAFRGAFFGADLRAIFCGPRPRFAAAFFADCFADAFFADPAFFPDALDRVLLPAFPRDFLARVAMTGFSSESVVNS
jgi:hypothetical protein